MAPPIRLTIADDHPITRAGLLAHFSGDRAFDVIGEFEDGPSALDGIRALRPAVALIDVRMPGMDGVSIVKAMTEQAMPTAAVMLTGCDSPHYLAAALRAGAKGFVLKSSPLGEISAAVRAAASGATYIDRHAAGVKPGDDAPIGEPISAREREVLMLASRGLPGKDIAKRLYISQRTVQTHLSSIYDKLGARNKTEAMLFALKQGIVIIEEILN